MKMIVRIALFIVLVFSLSACFSTVLHDSSATSCNKLNTKQNIEVKVDDIGRDSVDKIVTVLAILAERALFAKIITL